MFSRLRSLLFILLAAGAGAVLGRMALDMRERMEAGESPGSIDPRRITIRVQDMVPGLVAAFRVKDAPWSWFHIPSWMAAFGVNFGVAAVGGDIARIRAQAERAAFDFAGLDARDFGMGGYEDDVIDATSATGTPEASAPASGGDNGSGGTPSEGMPASPGTAPFGT